MSPPQHEPPWSPGVSLAERMGYLQVVRLVLALVVVSAALLGEGLPALSVSSVMRATAVYVLAVGSADLLRSFSSRRVLAVVSLLLLADGIFLAWACYATGGPDSSLVFLPLIHLVAVTLLASYRTGLKIAAWHSLLFLAFVHAQTAGLLEVVAPARLLPGGRDFAASSILRLTAFWG